MKIKLMLNNYNKSYVIIKDKNGNTIFSDYVLNECIFEGSKCSIYNIYIYTMDKLFINTIYTNTNSFIFSLNNKKHIYLTDSFYNGLPIKRGIINLWLTT